MSTLDTIIVGAGIGGLAAADELRRRGQDLLVLEASDRPGGRVVLIKRKNGDAAEAGAQGIHSNYREMLALIDRHGLTGSLRPAAGKIQFLGRAGEPILSGGNRDMFRILDLRGKFDLTKFWMRYFTFAKRFPQFELVRDLPEYDNRSVADVMRGAGADFRDFVLRPMTWAMANATPEHISMYYMISSLRQRMTTSIMGLSRGNASLLEKMAAGVPIRYGARVKAVLTTGGRVDGVELDNGEMIKARHVILACTAGAASSILTDEFAEARQFLGALPHTPMPLVFFCLDRPLRQQAYSFMGHPHRHADFNMALNHALKTPYLAPSGKGFVSAWPAFPRTVQLIEKSDAELVDLARRDLEPFFPGFSAWIEEAHVVRHSWGLARYEPGMHRKVLDFKVLAETFRGLSFAGTDLDSIHMESGVRSGQRAARRALAGA